MSVWNPTDFKEAKNINISADNPYYVSGEGVVYTKDMSRLLVYPTNKEAVFYKIPDGVSTIGPDAFADDFWGSWNEYLEELWLPASMTEFLISDVARQTLEGMVKLKTITVEEGNPVFSSVDGHLCNASGTYLFLSPRGKEGRIEVPSGIEVIYENAFGRDPLAREIILPEGVREIQDENFFVDYTLRGETLELYLPDSLETISNSYLEEHDGTEVPVRIHCSAGSYAEQFAKEHNLSYVIEE